MAATALAIAVAAIAIVTVALAVARIRLRHLARAVGAHTDANNEMLRRSNTRVATLEDRVDELAITVGDHAQAVADEIAAVTGRLPKPRVRKPAPVEPAAVKPTPKRAPAKKAAPPSNRRTKK